MFPESLFSFMTKTGFSTIGNALKSFLNVGRMFHISQKVKTKEKIISINYVFNTFNSEQDDLLVFHLKFRSLHFFLLWSCMARILNDFAKFDKF